MKGVYVYSLSGLKGNRKGFFTSNFFIPAEKDTKIVLKLTFNQAQI